MTKTLLIENSGLSFQCDPMAPAIRESVDKTGHMILKGVPATKLDSLNGNGRKYTTTEMNRSLKAAKDSGLFESRRLLCTADDHPEETFVPPIHASHIVVDAYTKKIGDQSYLLNDWLVLNTDRGRNLRAIVDAGGSFGTSIRGLGQLNESSKEIEQYEFLGTDAVGNPSAGTFASKEQFKVTVESVETAVAARLQEQFEVEMPKGTGTFNLAEKLAAYREKHLKNGKPERVTREMTADLLTLQRETVDAGVTTEALDALTDEIYGNTPPAPVVTPAPRPPAPNSNADRDLLNRAERELEATRNLAAALQDEVRTLETTRSEMAAEMAAYRQVAEGLQVQVDELVLEADTATTMESRITARKAVTTIRKIQSEAHQAITNLETRLESAIRIGDSAVDTAITLRRIADALYARQLKQIDSDPAAWASTRTAQATIESAPNRLTEEQRKNRQSGSGNRAGWY